MKQISKRNAEPSVLEQTYHFRAPGDPPGHPLLVPGHPLDTPGERLKHATEPGPGEGGAAGAETQGKVGF